MRPALSSSKVYILGLLVTLMLAGALPLLAVTGPGLATLAPRPTKQVHSLALPIDTLPPRPLSASERRAVDLEIRKLEREERLAQSRGRRGSKTSLLDDEERSAYNTATAGFVCSFGFVVLGILGLPASIVAVVLSSKALRKMRAIGPYAEGQGMAKAGLIIGIIGIAVSVLTVGIYIALLGSF